MIPPVTAADAPLDIDVPPSVGATDVTVTELVAGDGAVIELGDTVVVQGSGPIGLLTVACARLAGASRIIATGRGNRKRVSWPRRWGPT